MNPTESMVLRALRRFPDGADADRLAEIVRARESHVAIALRRLVTWGYAESWAGMWVLTPSGVARAA